MASRLAVAALALLAGCTGGGGAAPALPDGTLVIEQDGKEVARLPLENFDVFLVRDEKVYPEPYVLQGPQVVLCGNFPMDVHVGYGEKWDLLFQKKLAIDRRGGDRDQYDSSITMPGADAARVTGGWIQVESKDGKYADKSFLNGRLMLETEAPGGASKILFGRFRAHCNTWG